MSTAVTALVKAAVALLTDERSRKTIGWILAAVLSPVIILLAFLLALGSGAAAQNNATVEAAFNGYDISEEMPEEYRVYIREIQKCFEILDGCIAEINEMTEENSLDAARVKAVFFSLYFGTDAPGQSAQRQFTDCFVTYEERTRTVTELDEEGNEIEVEETYMVAIPIEDLETVYSQIEATLGIDINEDQRANAESIYSLIRYGWEEGSEWAGELNGPVISVDGFCSPLGAGWESRVTSEFGYRNCPYHGWELHSGLDMSAPEGTPIRAALPGIVIKSYYSSSYGNYTVIAHANALTTAYAHQSQRLVSVGDTVEAGQIIGLVGATGNATGPHLHLEVRLNNELQDPRLYLP